MNLLRRLVALALAALLVVPALASDGRSISRVPTRTAYAEDSSVGVDSSSEAVSYTGLPGYRAEEGVFTTCIENESTSGDLLVQIIPLEESVAASTLATPSNGIISPVEIVDPGEIVCWDGGFAGHIWQGKTTTVAARVRVRY